MPDVQILRSLFPNMHTHHQPTNHTNTPARQPASPPARQPASPILTFYPPDSFSTSNHHGLRNTQNTKTLYILKSHIKTPPDLKNRHTQKPFKNVNCFVYDALVKLNHATPDVAHAGYQPSHVNPASPFSY